MDYEFVEITDPQTGRRFYANVVSGECTWDKPKDKLVKLKNPDDAEWWELFDENHKLPYYYNTKSGETEWLKPTTGTVIPLISIQNSSIGKRVSVAIRRASTMNTFGDFSLPMGGPNQAIPSAAANSNTSTKQQGSQLFKHSSSLENETPISQAFTSSQSQLRELPVDNVSKIELSTSMDTGMLRAASKSSQQQFNGKKSSAELHNKPLPSIVGISNPVLNPEAAVEMRLLSKKATTRKDPGLRLSLPSDLKDHIERFQIDGFAKKYFSEHRRGIFRRRVPLEKMLHFQKEALKAPLLVLNKILHKDALKCFKLVQKAMGDRASKESYIDDLRTLANIGILFGELRDEVYVQVIKQLTENPNGGIFGNSVFRGWQALCVLAIAFPPSKNLEDYIKSFVRQHFNSSLPLASTSIPPNTQKPLNVLSRHLDRKIEKICQFGPRGKPLTDAEIERTIEAPFRVSVFGETLSEIMSSQIEDDRSRGIPVSSLPKILPFLTEAIIKLGGRNSEGIFRVPGDSDEVTDLKCRIEKGCYDFDGINDPNTPSSLLKLWLRELAEPLLPMSVYDECISLGGEGSNSSGDEYARAMAILAKLPPINRAVVNYVVEFLRGFREPDSVKATKMSPTNIAMVFAPNFLRCPSEDMTIIFENTKLEQAFLRILLTEKKP